jgi:6-phosphogluconolactonase
VVIVADLTALARAAAERVVAALQRAIERRGEAHVALTGGSTAVPLYEELAANHVAALDWGRVHLWWGDERLVPVDHPESNVGLAYATLLGYAQRAAESGTGGQGTDISAGDVPGLPVRPENVHPYGVDEALSESDPAGLVAERYAAELERFLPSAADGLPAFDLVLLGVGLDGHVLSVFAGSPALADDAPLVVSVPAPQHVAPHMPRLTINPRLLAAAHQILVLVSGEAKREAVARALAANGPADDPPARLARRANAVWLIDEAAAGQPATSE